MKHDEPLGEFLEDFGSQPMDAAQLQGLLDRARQSGDRELRLAVKQLGALRWLAGVLLERLEQAEPQANDSVINTARFMVRGEGAIE